MEELFKGNIIFVFFFTIIAIYNYSDLKEYQRISIVYITVFSLVVTKAVGIKLAIIFLFFAMFCFLEILTKDEAKFKIIVNPIYKIVDCLYLSFFQYSFLEILLAILFWNNHLKYLKIDIFLKFIAVVMLIIAVTYTLQQKYVINTFNEMYNIFIEFPIYKVDFNEKLNEACNILVSIEDSSYFQRKGYTFLSIDSIRYNMKRKLVPSKISDKIKYIFIHGKGFLKNVIKEKRGYSTIPMQLIRTLGVKRGYNYKYRRKVFELLYSRMFFDGIKQMFNDDRVDNRENINKYLLYIYFHKVNTFLKDVRFSKFLNAFDMQYNEKNKIDIYDCSNEGIFIACMGLSNRAGRINEDNIDYYLSFVNYPKLDSKIICEMVSEMMSRPYNGNYLK